VREGQAPAVGPGIVHVCQAACCRVACGVALQHAIPARVSLLAGSIAVTFDS
jgi:hypothetical protein